MRGFAIFCLLLHLVVNFYLPNRLFASTVNQDFSHTKRSIILPIEPNVLKEIPSESVLKNKDIDYIVDSIIPSNNIDPQILSVTEVNNSTNEEGGSGSLVNHFTGDLNYSIPLFEIDGYPMKLSYTSGATMEQEASWVGLGWTLAPGAINRSIRGLPDDFNGDKIVHSRYMKPNRTITLNTIIPLKSREFFGFTFPASRFSVGLNYNNYTGIYSSLGLAAAYKRSNSDATFGLSLNSSQRDGLTITPSYSLSQKFAEDNKVGEASGGLSLTLNSRGGLLELKPSSSTMGNVSIKKDDKTVVKPFSNSFGGSITFNNSYQSPPDVSMNNFSLYGSAKFSKYKNGDAKEIGTIGVNYRQATISDEDKIKERPAYGYLNLDSVYSGTSNSKVNIMDESLLDFAKDKDQGVSNYLPNLSMPFLTFDNYSLITQTFSSSFRPYKNNISVVFDPKSTSGPSTVTNLSPEIGLGKVVKVAFSGSFGFTETYIGPFINEDDRYNLVLNVLGYKTIESFNSASIFKDEGGFSTIDQNNIKYYNFYGKMNPSAFKLNRQEDDDYCLPNKDVYNGIGNSSSQQILTTVITLPEASSASNSLKPFKNEQIFKFDEFGSSIVPYSRKNCVEIVDWVKSIKHFEDNISSPAGDDFVIVQSNSRESANFISDHQIWAFEAKSSEGMVFRFGVPQITWFNEDFTSSVEAQDINYRDVPYTNSLFPKSHQEAVNNHGGPSKFFSKKRIPAHIEGYLISSVLSPDYIDKTLDGPTDDDAGTFVKFSYLKKHKSFGFRSPGRINFLEDYKTVQVANPTRDDLANTLNLSPNVQNLKGANSDDIASFSYSEKELWYVKEIEGRSSVAIFTLEDDPTKLSVDWDGNVDIDKPAQRLQQIAIYDKFFDKKRNVYVKASSPKLTILFGYYNIHNTDESLCGYKLTLKSLEFKEYNSSKGENRKFDFKYGQFISKRGNVTNLKANYNRFNQDRWGSPVFVHPVRSPSFPDLNSEIDDRRLPFEYPYVINSVVDVRDGGDAGQIDNIFNTADIKSNVWNLTQITTPTNTKIQIQYERDSYSMVENEKAGCLYKFDNFYSDEDCNIPLANLIGSDNLGSTIWAKLEIPKYMTSSLDFTDANVRSKLIRSMLTRANGSVIEQVYFKAWVKLRRDFEPELITGYANVDNANNAAIARSRILGTNSNAYISIPINSELLFKNSVGDKITPIAKASYNRLKNDLRFIFNNHIADPALSLDDFVPFFLGSFKEIYNTVLGFNNRCKRLQLANELDNSRNTYFRLGSASGEKFGANQRVKSVKYINNVDVFGRSGALRNGITVLYNYKLDGANLTSGVATSEPLLGQEDNLKKYPLAYERELVLAPDLSFSQELPYGESLLHSPTVGYSMVTVTEQSNLAEEGDNKFRLGAEVYTFYTAKDFPSQISLTPLQKLSKSKESPANPYFTYNLNSYGCSQGFALELNNMHGKPKSKRIYGGFDLSSNITLTQKSSPISGVDYYYKLRNGRVFNQATYVDKELNISPSEPDFTSNEFDWIVYNREEYSVSRQFEININLEVLLIGPFIVPFPIPIPYISKTEDRFKYIAFTKQRSVYGMIDSTVTFDLSNHVVSKVEAFDKHTGEPVVSSITNSFKDKQYSVSIPAYWVYSTLGKSNMDAGKVYSSLYDISIPNGTFLKILGNSGFSTIIKNGNGVSFVQGNGNIVSGRLGNLVEYQIPNNFLSTINIKQYLSQVPVLSISSGNKNMLTIPAQTANFITNPLEDNRGNKLSKLNLSGSVIDAKAFVFDKYQCENVNGLNKMAYIESYYKPTASYYYKSDRVQTRINQNVNLRRDGIYTSFSPFWNILGSRLTKNPKNWVMVDTILTIDEFGFPLETVDKTNRVITRIPGNSASMLRLEAFNARTSDLFFEDFELNSSNTENSLDFKSDPNSLPRIQSLQSHSGNSSFEFGDNVVTLDGIEERLNLKFTYAKQLVPQECKELECANGGGGSSSECCKCPLIYFDTKTKKPFFVFDDCPDASRQFILIKKDNENTLVLKRFGNSNHFLLDVDIDPNDPFLKKANGERVDCEFIDSSSGTKCSDDNDEGNGSGNVTPERLDQEL